MSVTFTLLRSLRLLVLCTRLSKQSDAGVRGCWDMGCRRPGLPNSVEDTCSIALLSEAARLGPESLLQAPVLPAKPGRHLPVLRVSPGASSGHQGVWGSFLRVCALSSARARRCMGRAGRAGGK